MPKLLSVVGKQLEEPQLDASLSEATALLTELVEEEAYVGEVYSLGYEEALVQIHDFHRRQVGGIPALSFLIATRIVPSNQIDVHEGEYRPSAVRVYSSALPTDWGRACSHYTDGSLGTENGTLRDDQNRQIEHDEDHAEVDL
jgi:hypothetical protein